MPSPTFACRRATCARSTPSASPRRIARKRCDGIVFTRLAELVVLLELGRLVVLAGHHARRPARRARRTPGGRTRGSRRCRRSARRRCRARPRARPRRSGRLRRRGRTRPPRRADRPRRCARIWSASGWQALLARDRGARLAARAVRRVEVLELGTCRSRRAASPRARASACPARRPTRGSRRAASSSSTRYARRSSIARIWTSSRPPVRSLR